MYYTAVSVNKNDVLKYYIYSREFKAYSQELPSMEHAVLLANKLNKEHKEKALKKAK